MKKFLTYASLAVTIMASGITHVSAGITQEEIQNRVETGKNNVITQIITPKENQEIAVKDSILSLYVQFCKIEIGENTSNNDFQTKMIDPISLFYQKMRENINNAALENAILGDTNNICQKFCHYLKILLKGLTNRTGWTITPQSIDQWGKEQTEIFKKFFKDLKENPKKNSIEEKLVNIVVPAEPVVQNKKLEEENKQEEQLPVNDEPTNGNNEFFKTFEKEYEVAPDNNNENENINTPEVKNLENQNLVKQEDTNEESDFIEKLAGFLDNNENKKTTTTEVENVPVKQQEVKVEEENTWHAAGYSESMKKALQNKNNNTTEKKPMNLKTAWKQFKPTYAPRGYFHTPYCNCTKVKNPFLSNENYKAFENFVQQLHKTVTEWRKDAKALINQPNDNDREKIIELGKLIKEISLQLPDMLTTCIKDTETEINKNAGPLLEYWFSKPITVEEEETLKKSAQNVITSLTCQMEYNDETEEFENTALFRLNEEEKNLPYFDIIQNLKKKLEME